MSNWINNPKDEYWWVNDHELISRTAVINCFITRHRWAMDILKYVSHPRLVARFNQEIEEL